MSSSIPSWQILTAHAQPFRGARDLAFCLKVPLDSLLVWASSEGSGETARMRRLAWTFAARIGDKYQIHLTRSVLWYCFTAIMFENLHPLYGPWLYVSLYLLCTLHSWWLWVGFGDSLRVAEARERWKGIVATSSLVPRRPSIKGDEMLHWLHHMHASHHCLYLAGADRFCKDIAIMTGRDTSVFLRVLWVIVVPGFMVVGRLR